MTTLTISIEEQIKAEFEAIFKADELAAKKEMENFKIEGDFSTLRGFINKGVKMSKLTVVDVLEICN